MTKEKVNLGVVQETLLIPLYFRSLEAKKENPRIDASYDVELVNQLDYDFSKFTGKWSMEGCVVRAVILDKEVQKYINEHPDCIVLNFGCGLCTRALRLDIKNSKWYNFDFPDTIELRNKLVKEKPNCYNIPKSMLDETWPSDVNASADKDVLVIVEGVFMYLTEAEIKKFINIIQSNYKKAFALIEIMSNIMAKNSKHHDTVNETSASFVWGIKHCKDLEKIDKGIKYFEEWNYFDYYENQGMFFKVAIKVNFFKNICNKIASYEITAKSE